MSNIEAGCALGPVQLRAHDGAQVADCVLSAEYSRFMMGVFFTGDLHRVGRRSFCLTADVVGGPGEHDGGGWIDAAGRKDGPRIRDASLFAGEKNDVADDGEAGAAHDKWGPDFRLLGRDGNDHGQAGGHDIRRHRE